jgi:CheY-like chemotaxis protein
MLRILIVDDLADTADSLASLLRLCGHAPRVALRGNEAIAEAEAFLPHVLLVDIAMPGMGGLEVARRVHALPGMGGALVVATTGFDGEEIRAEASEAGIEHFFVKPYDTDVLLALLDTYEKEGKGVPVDSRPPSWFETKI